jgi:rhizosphere induced protein
MSGTTYTLRVVNKSNSQWDMCVYQVDPDIGLPNVMSLAWFSKSAHDGTSVTFRWTLDYSFIWAETGQLVPGVYFDATQIWPADPTIVAPATAQKAGNQVGLTKSDGAFTFTSTPTPGASSGSLYIKQDGTIPSNRVSVGVGMSGSGTFAVQGKPNINLNFTPHPVYWLAAGSFAQGEVLDIGSINNPTDIRFPANVYSLTAVLDERNEWSVKSTEQVNARDHKRIVGQHRNQMAGSR